MGGKMGGWGQPSRMCLLSLGRVKKGRKRGQAIWEDRQIMTGVHGKDRGYLEVRYRAAELLS